MNARPRWQNRDSQCCRPGSPGTGNGPAGGGGGGGRDGPDLARRFEGSLFLEGRATPMFTCWAPLSADPGRPRHASTSGDGGSGQAASGRAPAGPGPLPGTRDVGGAGGVDPCWPHHAGSSYPSLCLGFFIWFVDTAAFLELCKSHEVQCGAGRAVPRRLDFTLKPLGGKVVRGIK